MRNELFCSLDSVALCVDEGGYSLKSVYSQYLQKQLLQLTNPSMRTNVGVPKTDITSGFCSLVVVKVTFVVSSSKNI